MSASIIPHLVRKDFLLWRRLILIFCGLSLTSIATVGLLHGHVPDHVLLNLGFTLVISPVGTLGIVLLMQSNVFEKVKSTQSFIMSLPVTVREFTLAKLLFNVPIFTALWLVATAASFSYAFGFGLLPPGAMPMLTMVFLGVFVAYAGVLSVSLLSQSLSTTILAILFFETGTPAYLWVIVLLDPISKHVLGPVAVWNGAAVAVVIAQALAAVAAIGATVVVQTRRRDSV